MGVGTDRVEAAMGDRGAREMWVAGVAVLVALVAIGLVVVPKGSYRDEGGDDGDEQGAPPTVVVDESAGGGDDAGSVLVGALAVGDCFDNTLHRSDKGRIGDITVVECDEPHDGEVFFVAEITGDEPPGVSAERATVIGSCDPAFESYVGIDYDDSQWNYGYFSPSEVSWYEDGDRDLVCYVDHPDLEKTTGSAEGAGN
jgi:hypothetical protein